MSIRVLFDFQFAVFLLEKVKIRKIDFGFWIYEKTPTFVRAFL